MLLYAKKNALFNKARFKQTFCFYLSVIISIPPRLLFLGRDGPNTLGLKLLYSSFYGVFLYRFALFDKNLRRYFKNARNRCKDYTRKIQHKFYESSHFRKLFSALKSQFTESFVELREIVCMHRKISITENFTLGVNCALAEPLA